MLRSLPIVLVLVLVLAPPAPLGAITNGQPDDGDPARYPYVAGVVDVTTGNFCSGVAIEPTVLLTAAHCFDEPGQGVFVSFALDVSPGTFPGPDWHFGIWHPHPDFCFLCSPAQTDIDTHDVAVVVLDQPVALAAYATAPAAPGFVDGLPVRTRLTLVGYGLQWDTPGGNFRSPQGVFTRHYAEAELVPSQHVNADEFIALSQNPALNKGGDCRGDSGGPALIGNVIVGLTSYGNLACTGVGYSNRVDLDYALDFIGGFLE